MVHMVNYVFVKFFKCNCTAVIFFVMMFVFIDEKSNGLKL